MSEPTLVSPSDQIVALFRVLGSAWCNPDSRRAVACRASLDDLWYTITPDEQSAVAVTIDSDGERYAKGPYAPDVWGEDL
jgi:hypothetical protein